MVALLAQYCVLFIVLDRGQIALDGAPHEVFAHASELRAIGVDSPRTARVSNSLSDLGACQGNAAGPEHRRGGGAARAPHSATSSALAAADHTEMPYLRATTNEPPSRCLTEQVSNRAEGTGRDAASSLMVELRGVSFSYGPGSASVDGIDLSVKRGEELGARGAKRRWKDHTDQAPQRTAQAECGQRAYRRTRHAHHAREHPRRPRGDPLPKPRSPALPPHRPRRGGVWPRTPRHRGAGVACERAAVVVERFGLPTETPKPSASRAGSANWSPSPASSCSTPR